MGSPQPDPLSAPAARRLGRHRPRSSKVFALAALVAVAGAAVGVGGWIWNAGIGRIHHDDQVVGELSPPPANSDDPVNYLVVGSDSREKIRDDAGDRFGPAGTTTGERADVVMLVRFSLREHEVRVLSIPRDLQLEVDGFGLQKLSATLALGGSRLLVRTTKELTGQPVHHYVELDFVGFAEVVDSIGGVWLDFPAPARDVYSGLQVDAGRRRLDGDAALALVRSRSYEEWHDGAWIAVDDGDRARINRQHQFLGAVASRAGGGSIPTKVRRLTRLGRHVTVDGSLSILDLARLVHRVLPVDLDDHDLQTLPTEPVLTIDERTSPFPPLHVGAIAYERLAQPAAAATIQAFVTSSVSLR